MKNKEIYNNMIMLDDSKICPRCGKIMWQYRNRMVECLNCYLWGWLPDNDIQSEKDEKFVMEYI